VARIRPPARTVDDEHIARVGLISSGLPSGRSQPSSAATPTERRTWASPGRPVGHGLLHVLQVEALRPDPLDRRRDAPDHVRVDPDLHVGSHLVADRRDRVVILPEVATDLELQLGGACID
jgi:hypothetical protein